MSERADSGIEIRRILLLTKLRESPRGMTMDQIAIVCRKVPGFSFAGTSLWQGAREVLQSLINDKLVAVRTRFSITAKGQEYLSDPLKWKLNVETTEEVERRLFWNSIYDVFDRALARLRAKSPEKKLPSLDREHS